MDSTFNDEIEDDDDDREHVRLRDSIIFIVDGNQKMFENNYFYECLENFMNIVRQKCVKNTKDMMSFIILGTKSTNCNINNLYILQEFSEVTIDTLKHIKNTMQNDIEKFEQMASTNYSEYPLVDALTHALQVSRQVEFRTVVLLCTCNDNPFSTNPVERRRIEHLVAEFKPPKQFCVVGLSDSWNDEVFYKELQSLSGTSDADNNYRRLYLKDFEQSIINPSRSTCRVPWIFSEKVFVDVSLYNLISPPKYLSEKTLGIEDNNFLESRQMLRGVDSQESEDQRDKKEMIIQGNDDGIVRYKPFGGEHIAFKPDECGKMKNLGLKPCIKVLAFKPISCDPQYHVHPPYFVTYSKDASHESKSFFKAFVKRCFDKKIMAICCIITKYNAYTSLMIPSDEDGGFYSYELASNDKVRDLDDQLGILICDEKKCPVNDEAVTILRKMIDLSKQKFHFKLFKNPKLEKCIAHIEALALDEKLNSLPSDKTVPPAISGDISALRDQVMKLLDLIDIASGAPKNKKKKLDFAGIAQRRQLHSLTVMDLKEFLKSIQKSTGGRKSDLEARIYDYFDGQ